MHVAVRYHCILQIAKFCLHMISFHIDITVPYNVCVHINSTVIVTITTMQQTIGEIHRSK